MAEESSFPDVRYLAMVKAGRAGGLYHGAAGRKPHFEGCNERWRAHYVEGLVTYPGASTRGFTPIMLTEKGEQALAPTP